ncbi:hypothetical protein DVH24_005268 [Malus domestica]|uniref:Uncharacterized protein n=1 Tax=Malus domestica TaxID=3750 RepID=A0A498KP82_MALDO|nr:hypothetical protein DVH24_005268 [Malus domestica]
MSPVAMSLEELVPANKSYIYSILIRTALVVSTLVVGLCIPFFVKSVTKTIAGLVMSLIGSLFTMLVLRTTLTNILLADFDTSLCLLSEHLEGTHNSISVGVVSSAFGTFSAISKIVENLRSPT